MNAPLMCCGREATQSDGHVFDGDCFIEWWCEICGKILKREELDQPSEYVPVIVPVPGMNSLGKLLGKSGGSLDLQEVTPHPSQDALDCLYYLYFMVQTEGEDFLPMQWVEEHRPYLFRFLTQLFHQVTTEEQMDTQSHVAYWVLAIPKAVEELS